MFMLYSHLIQGLTVPIGPAQSRFLLAAEKWVGNQYWYKLATNNDYTAEQLAKYRMWYNWPNS